MASHFATAEWALEDGEDFIHGRYSRGHAVTFEGGHAVPGTASRHVVGDKWAAKGAVDPEEMLVGSIAACHMLSFLHEARLAGFVVTHYRDEAVGLMEKNAQGRPAVTRVTLRPQIDYSGGRPTDAERDHLHHLAHEGCFIANSVKTKIVVVEQAPDGER
jgi:organic hydroperoxide reductase OsmC/OhrA